MTVALSLVVARHEKRTRKQPHRILPVHRHAEHCLYNDGTIGTPAHACTCKPVHVGYTLQLITR